MSQILLVLAMGAVTYIPRMLPMVLLQNIHLPAFVNRLLRFIPFAALGALIFPGILTSTGSQPHVAIAGGIMAVVISLLELNIVFVVLASILGALLWTLFVV